MPLTRSDFPDWVRGMLLIGQDDAGNQVPVFVGDDGRIYTWLIGADAGGDPQTVKVDSDGQLYVILRGADGVDVAVDASGFLTAVLKGVDSESVLRTVAVDDGGQMIMVPRGQSGNYLLVDSDGYMTAVLKGLKDSTLTTISVDAQGRIEAFGLDAESQWGDILKTGSSELAARLGSLKVWDWRGQLYWSTDFSQGTGNALRYPVGTGSEIVISPDYWVSGGYSLKLTGGSDGTRLAYVNIYIDHPPASVVGLEIQYSGDLDFEHLMIRLRRYISNNVYDMSLRILPKGLNSVEYLDDNGDWQVAGSNFQGTSTEMFNHVKVVGRFDTNEYVRALWADTEVDLSGIGMYRYGAGYLNQALITVELKSSSGENESKYLDSILFTVSEPL